MQFARRKIKLLQINFKKMILNKKIKFTTNLLDKTIGLIGNHEFNGIVFKTRFGIHTFGLKETITVLILDKNKKVVKTKYLDPNSLFFWNPKYFWVIELRKKVQIKVGDKISF